MSVGRPEPELACVLRLAFGEVVPAVPLALPPGRRERGQAFRLYGGGGLPPGVILLHYPAHEQTAAFRAFTVTRALYERRFPVPETYYLGWSHHTQYVMLLTALVEGRGEDGDTPGFFARAGADFARTLARLHLLRWETPPDLPLTPLHFAVHELGMTVRRLENWHLHQLYGWIMARLDRVSEHPRVVIHGDYRLQNIVLAENGRVAAVQGWEQAAIADPRFDVGYASAVLGAHDPALSERFLAAYSAAAGPVIDGDFWDALGALRLLVRVVRTVSSLYAPQRDRFLARVGPAWQGLLAFVERRCGGLRLL